MAGDLATGPDEAHNVGVEGQLALQVYLLLEQLQGLRVQPCTTKFWSLFVKASSPASSQLDHMHSG